MIRISSLPSPPHIRYPVCVCLGPELPLYPRPRAPGPRKPAAAGVGTVSPMSNLTLPIPISVLQSQVDVLGPGIAGLFIQGLLTGLVLTQFFRWFSSSERHDSVAFSALVVFVTIVGL